MTRAVEHVKRRRLKGLCAYPGCQVESGEAYRCQPHKEAHAAREKKRLADKALASQQEAA